jgi:DNA polymerase III alpha subunit
MEAGSSLANIDTGIELLYRELSLDGIPFEDGDIYNEKCRELGLTMLQTTEDWSTEYNIPQEYKDIDVEAYVRDALCGETLDDPTQEQLDRVNSELKEYEARNLFPVLQLMIYIVDEMRNNNIVWGVGRGSSVSSYVLYLLDVHKIDSVKYELDIKEFLK